jgi:CPA2 family monovalent cation:H+ antiporter-2
LFSAIPDPYEAGHIIEAAREANSNIRIIARAHSEEAKTYLRSIGADVVLIGEDELGRSMVTAAVPA